MRERERERERMSPIISSLSPKGNPCRNPMSHKKKTNFPNSYTQVILNITKFNYFYHI